MNGPSYTFAIGGIYGQVELLDAALGAISERADSGTVVLLGNYGFGGDSAVHVVDRLMAGPPPGWTWLCLAGNLEHELIEVARTDGYAGPIDYGAVPRHQLEWLARLPLIQVDQHRVYVHAGVDDAFGLNEQSISTLLYAGHGKRDAGGYRGRHLVHAHEPMDPRNADGRTSLEYPGFGSLGTLVAMFDDTTAGPPLEVVHIIPAGSMTAPNPPEGRVDKGQRLREALLFEEEQLARMREAMSKGDLDDVQRSIWPGIISSHQLAIFQYRQRLADIEVNHFVQSIPQSARRHG